MTYLSSDYFENVASHLRSGNSRDGNCWLLKRFRLEGWNDAAFHLQ